LSLFSRGAGKFRAASTSGTGFQHKTTTPADEKLDLTLTFWTFADFLFLNGLTAFKMVAAGCTLIFVRGHLLSFLERLIPKLRL
jgi:acyl-coenzyme A synthetase/AMP-(fatty) acid ligase